MNKILILYSSITGNTLAAATILHENLVASLPGFEFDFANVNETEPDKLFAYKIVIFGTSTWDENNNPDTEDFFIKVGQDKPDYSGIHIAVFGLGDTAYTEFCGSLPQVKEAFEKCGAVVSPDFFKIDGFPTDESAAGLVDWAKKFIVAQQELAKVT